MQDHARQKIELRLARLEQQIKAFKELHANELQLILDELATLRSDIAAMAPPTHTETTGAVTPPTATLADPAAASPKRAAWLAEQERKERQRHEPLSRRELLRGRDDDEAKT